MGGHGFSSYSKLGTLYNDHDINNTWEGDNTVLLQQSTKYVFDMAKRAMKKEKVSPMLQFLANPIREEEIVFSQETL